MVYIGIDWMSDLVIVTYPTLERKQPFHFSVLKTALSIVLLNSLDLLC